MRLFLVTQYASARSGTQRDKQRFTLVVDASVTHATISNELRSLLRMQFELLKYLFTVSVSGGINIATSDFRASLISL